MNAFPSVQFIVASHNPFIVGSVPESNVYILDYDKDKRVNSTYLDTANRAGSSNEILRDVLGLEATTPIWVEQQIGSLVDEFSGQKFDTESLERLRVRLGQLGLDKFVPSTIARLFQEQVQDDKAQ